MADVLAPPAPASAKVAAAAVTRRAPLDGRAVSSAADRAAAVAATAPATRIAVRGRPGTAKAAAAALGFALPTEVCRAAGAGDVSALWLGPDEWLVIAPDGRGPDLASALDAALAGIPHSVVDVSHRNCGVMVSGPQAARVIAHGCPLDLGLAAFPVGMCTRTLIGKVEVVLWRTAAESFHIEVWRSYARYLVEFLDEARREHEVG